MPTDNPVVCWDAAGESAGVSSFRFLAEGSERDMIWAPMSVRRGAIFGSAIGNMSVGIFRLPWGVVGLWKGDNEGNVGNKGGNGIAGSSDQRRWRYVPKASLTRLLSALTVVGGNATSTQDWSVILEKAVESVGDVVSGVSLTCLLAGAGAVVSWWWT
jgi:hypothetical protein